MATTQLNKSVQKNAGNDAITKMTFSAWIKRSALGEGMIFAAHQLSTYYTHFYFNSDDRIQIYSFINSSTAANLVLERRFRDTNAWYHIVLTIDTTLGTDSDRMKVYVNGVRETVTNGGTTYPSQSSAFGQFSDTGATLNIGNTANRGAFNGLMSHVHYIPYTAYDASAFGSTDSTTGEWKINTSPSLTYSTAGFFILKDGNSVTDQSGNSNNFTVGAGTLTKTEDCPSNVFATLNPLFQSGGNDLNRGNTQSTNNTSNWYWRPSTLAATSGKYYCEVRISAVGASIVGIADLDDCVGYAPVDTHFGKTAVSPSGRGFAWYSDDGKIYYNNTSSSVFGTYTTSDILSLAMDIDNGAFYIGKNGTWLNSGDPTSGSSKTGAVSTWTGGGTWTFANAVASNSVEQFNYGNGIFGQSTAVASAGTNASNIGIFEYDVPTGYTALSTKGLNE